MLRTSLSAQGNGAGQKRAFPTGETLCCWFRPEWLTPHRRRSMACKRQIKGGTRKGPAFSLMRSCLAAGGHASEGFPLSPALLAHQQSRTGHGRDPHQGDPQHQTALVAGGGLGWIGGLVGFTGLIGLAGIHGIQLSAAGITLAVLVRIRMTGGGEHTGLRLAAGAGAGLHAVPGAGGGSGDLPLTELVGVGGADDVGTVADADTGRHSGAVGRCCRRRPDPWRRSRSPAPGSSPRRWGRCNRR